MDDMIPDATLGRRDLIVRLAGIALSFTGLTAFRRLAPLEALQAAPKWDDRFELAVAFEIATPRGERYHRPYVAVWVEDSAGNPVRTLSVWVNTSGKGPRYIRELRRWVAAERDTESAGGPDLIATVSSATRLPGRYEVTWDGRDDRGNAVAQGNYRVLIEAAREHGTYQLMQQQLSLGAKPVAADLGGNDEIASARVEYRRRK
jgi:hypothetical protein